MVFAFIIKKDCQVKETFSYEIPFNQTTQQSLVEYTHANYGPEAVLRQMTEEERLTSHYKLRIPLKNGDLHR